MFNNRYQDCKLLTTLPYDVINLIINHLSLHERIQCIQVCKTWRSLFLSSSKMWSDISECQNIAHNLSQYDIKGKDIQKVDILKDTPSGAAFLWGLQCTNIRSLTMAYHDPGQKVLFHLTRYSLTNLCIVMMTQTTTEAFFSMLFNSCQNLQCLEINISIVNRQATGFSDWKDAEVANKISKSTQAIEAMKRLQELRISQYKTMRQVVFKRILSYFTGLKHLYLAGGFDDFPLMNDRPGFLDWVDDTFPSLQTIWPVRSSRTIFIRDKISIPHLKNEIIYGKQGRKSLTYDGARINPKSVDRFLKKHAPILDAFHTTVDYSSEPSFNAMQRFINRDLVAAAYHLQSLIIENYASGVYVDGVPIAFPKFDLEPALSHFPSLEQLKVIGINLKDTTTATERDKETKNDEREKHYRSLRGVEFSYCKGFDKSMLSTCINNRFQQKMDYVRFMGLDDLLDDALDAVAKNVQSLGQLGFGQEELDNNTIRRIADVWSSKQLRSLRLYLNTFKENEEIESQQDAIAYAQQKLKYTTVNDAILLAYDRRTWA
ncbi:hypothetical protein BDA99DRAFT_335716 [Phascolomyces articulosus]|uniref:F-box domain-containing protein n=1 Tax=Phascolomyces articulosus TaxID=60185 RepID=A0AAD5KEH6_9FUNG|nr:hypothetical protein BDA99DRAFT_335716 [Phascolomyces articulosus]